MVKRQLFANAFLNSGYCVWKRIKTGILVKLHGISSMMVALRFRVCRIELTPYFEFENLWK